MMGSNVKISDLTFIVFVAVNLFPKLILITSKHYPTVDGCKRAWVYRAILVTVKLILIHCINGR